MSRITRVKAVPFGAAGTTDDFETFGSTAAGAADFSKDIAAIQATSAWANGWRDALISAKAPVLQDMNGKMLVDSNLLCYLFQEGVPEYDSTTTYYKGGVVKNLANTGYTEFYISLTDTNLGNALPSRTTDTNWQFLFARSATGLIIGAGLVGVTDGSDAAAGNVGAEVRQTVVPGSAVTLTVGQETNICSIPLTAGDWDVSGIAVFLLNGATATGNVAGVLSQYSGNTTTDQVIGDNAIYTLPPTATADASAVIPAWRVSANGATTVYLKGSWNSGTGSPLAFGRISARRVR